MFGRIRIVTLVRLQIAAVATLLLAILGITLVSSFNERSEVLRVERVNAAIDGLLTATENMAVERGTTNTALRGEAPVSREVRAQIDKRRAASDPALGEAFAILEDLRIPNAQEEFAALKARLSDLQGLRAAADRELTSPRSARDGATVQNWMPTIIATMEAVSELSVALGREVRLSDPLVAEQVQVKQLAWAVRDSAGRERATIGGALASGTGLGEAQRSSITALRGRVDFGWEQIREIASRPGADPRLANQVATTHGDYFETFRSRSDSVIEAYAEGTEAPMSGPEWYDLSNPALASIMQVKNVSTEVTQDILADQQSRATMLIAAELVVAAISLLVLLVTVLTTQQRLARPVALLGDAIEGLKNQDYDSPMPLRDRQDELGSIASALDGLREEGLRARRLTLEREEEQAASLKRSQEIEKFTQEFQANVSQELDGSLAVTASVHEGAGKLSEAAGQADERAQSVAAASEQASSNVQTVAAATEELVASIREINQQIEQSRELSHEAVDKARETSSTVSGLSDMAGRIDTVIGLITDIAEQTNLLALNATIEAARAGEAGKGFAVVASEVKNLAKQTADATSEIDTQIRAMQVSTGEVVSAVDGIGSIIARLSEFAATIAAAAEEQGAATQEIARNVQEAAAGTQHVSDSMDAMQGDSKTTSDLAATMLNDSETLKSRAERLREEVQVFLEKVRKA